MRHLPVLLLLLTGVLAGYHFGGNLLVVTGWAAQLPGWDPSELWASVGLVLVIGAWLARSFRELARVPDPSRPLAVLAIAAGLAALLGRPGDAPLSAIAAALAGRESDLAAGTLAAGLGAALLLERRWPVAALVSVGTLGAALSLEELVANAASLGGAVVPLRAGSVDAYDALILLGVSAAIGLLGVLRALDAPIRQRILAAISSVVILALVHSLAAGAAVDDLVAAAGGSAEARFLAASALATRGTLLVLLVGSAAISVVVVAATITRPLELLVDAIRRYAEGDRTARSGIARSDEIGTVARAVDRLAQTVEAAEVEERRLLAVVREDQQRLRAIVDNALDAFVTMDAAGRIVDWNKSAEAIFGWSRADVVGRHVEDTIVPPLLRGAHGRGLAGTTRAPDGLLLGRRQRVMGLHRDGHVFPIEIAATTLGQGDAVVYSAFIKDVTELEEQEAALKRLALYDPLTELPNRTLLEDRWQLALAAARRDGTLVAIAVLDLDQFKAVNDGLGHPAGDALLREVARRLRAVLRATDTVARLGGDEFAVLLGGLARESEAMTGARTLLSALESPIVAEGQPVYLGASVGLATASQDHPLFEETMRRADVAMNEAKRRGGGDVSVYDPQADADRPETIALVADLHAAIERNELSVAYQPIVEADSGRCLRFEALARWEHPQRGPVPPSVFVELAERSGLIRSLGLQVLERALHDLVRWRTAGLETALGVNVSMRQLGDSAFVDTVLATLRDLGLPPDRLTIEVTESAIMREAGRVLEELTRLRAAGVHVSVDDFGTGYSSLAYLRSLPVDEIKLDKSLVHGAAEHADGVAIVRAAAALARAMDLCFVAEGVEDARTWDFLRTIGRSCVQGYFVARPMPPDAVPAWSAAWDRRVGEEGVEPSRSFEHKTLNLARLPITPLARAEG